jgi:hypothetical protein
MRRNLRLLILLLPLALAALMAERVEAASQILGLIASNGVPTPLRCEDGVCQGFFSSFCLQRERPSPAFDSKYRLAPGGGIAVIATRADGSTLRLPGDGLVIMSADAGFTLVTISLPEAKVKALGAASASIEIAPLTSILPLAVAGDANPQSPADIAYATGTLRRLAERSFEAPGAESDAVRLLTLLINDLPDDEPQTASGRHTVWDKTLASAGGAALDPAGVAEVARIYNDCSDTLMAFGLKHCMKLHHGYLMTTTNRGFWDSLGGS